MMRYWIDVTKDCNLQCRYCYQKENHQAIKMSHQSADKIIDYIIREDADDIGINFFGGEALLYFEIIKYVVERLAPMGVKHFSTTTNLVALTEQMIDFFVQHDFNLLISLDGTKETHDRDRLTKNNQGTFDIVYQNLQKLMHYPNLNLRVAKVLTMDNLVNYYQDYLFLKSLELPVIVNVELEGLYLDDGSLLETYQRQLDLVFADYLQTRHSGTPIHFSNYDGYYQRYLNMRKVTANESNAHETPCIRPSNIQLVFDVHGQVHPCHMMVETDMGNTALPFDYTTDAKELRKNLFTLNPMFRPLTDDEVYTNLQQEIEMKECNKCRYLTGCLEYMLLSSKSSCIYKRYQRRVMQIDQSRKLFCLIKMVFQAMEKHIKSPLAELNLRGDK